MTNIRLFWIQGPERGCGVAPIENLQHFCKFISKSPQIGHLTFVTQYAPLFESFECVENV